MEDLIYVQFYTNDNTSYTNPDSVIGFTYLSNGFSSAYNNLKNEGEFIWFETLTIDDAVERKNGAELPITNGIVYVSCWYYQHLIQVEMWARKYPEVKFIVGGPAFIAYKNFAFPRNVEVRKTNLKKSKWGIKFPNIGLKNVMYTYNIGDKCYWNKCLFCDYIDIEEDDLLRDGSDLEIQGDFNHYVWLHQPSISPQFLKRIPKLRMDENIYYRMFLRGDEVSRRAIVKCFEECEKTSFNFSHLWFGVGIEFPSNRVLDWMKKGVTVESLLKMLRILFKYGCDLQFFLILRLPITEKDYESAIKFIDEIDKMPKTIKPKAHILPYAIFNDRIDYDAYKDMELESSRRPFTSIIKLTERQKVLNDKLRDRYYESFLPIQDYYTYRKKLLK